MRGPGEALVALVLTLVLTVPARSSPHRAGLPAHRHVVGHHHAAARRALTAAPAPGAAVSLVGSSVWGGGAGRGGVGRAGPSGAWVYCATGARARWGRLRAGRGGS